MKSFWVLVSGFLFAIMGVFVKYGSEQFTSAELVFYRSLIGLIIISVIMGMRQTSFTTKHLSKHIARGVLGTAGLILYFYTITILPLAMAVTLNHTAPIFFAILAAVLFSEQLSRQSIFAILIGFVGVVILLRPSVDSTQVWGCLIGLLVGLLNAVGYHYIKHLGQLGEPETRTVFYYTLIGTICAGLWALVTGIHAVTLQNFLILLALGLSATFAQLALTRAYKMGKSILTTSLTYTNVLFASIFGIIIWSEVLPILSWVAFALIIFSGILSSIDAFSKERHANKGTFSKRLTARSSD